MKKPNIPYHKLNFGLSVIGFIGSLGFYYGVLRKVYTEDKAPDQKQQVEALKKENKELKDQLQKCSNTFNQSSN